VNGPLSSGDGSVLYGWALSGEGISLEAHWDVADDLAAGRLVEVMPDYRGPPAELYAVFAPGKPVPPRIRLFADCLAKAFARISRGDREG
jgi:DNA-binding transcriptional LysR family regulator